MRLLLIEADRLTQERVSLMLRAEGHSLYETEDGEEGVDLARIYAYDLILLGSTEDMAQSATLSRMRANKVASPIIVMGTADVDRMARMLDSGADDHVVMPVHRTELIARINAVVRRVEGHCTNAVDIGNMRIDIQRRVVTIAGREIHTTGTERKMLELMARRRGQCVTKDAFMHHLYDGHRDDPEPKIVDVFICKLRKRLKDAGLTGTSIITVWGQGYRLADPPAMSVAA